MDYKEAIIRVTIRLTAGQGVGKLQLVLFPHCLLRPCSLAAGPFW